MPKAVDLTGRTFGDLYVMYRTKDHIYSNGRRDIVYHCKCKCGNEVDVLAVHLRSGHTTSCGCYRKTNTAVMRKTHGHSRTRLYNIWKSMIARCNFENCAHYNDYGGRGIKVCPAWRDYLNFFSWAINNGYEDNLTIDRIDVNGNYEPSNCRWVTLEIQAKNRRQDAITIDGVTRSLYDWSIITMGDYERMKEDVKLCKEYNCDPAESIKSKCAIYRTE